MGSFWLSIDGTEPVLHLIRCDPLIGSVISENFLELNIIREKK